MDERPRRLSCPRKRYSSTADVRSRSRRRSRRPVAIRAPPAITVPSRDEPYPAGPTVLLVRSSPVAAAPRQLHALYRRPVPVGGGRRRLRVRRRARRKHDTDDEDDVCRSEGKSEASVSHATVLPMNASLRCPIDLPTSTNPSRSTGSVAHDRRPARRIDSEPLVREGDCYWLRRERSRSPRAATRRQTFAGASTGRAL